MASAIDSRASANARNGYYSSVDLLGEKSIEICHKNRVKRTNRIGFLGNCYAHAMHRIFRELHHRKQYGFRNQIANNAESIMNAAFNFLNNLKIDKIECQHFHYKLMSNSNLSKCV